LEILSFAILLRESEKNFHSLDFYAFVVTSSSSSSISRRPDKVFFFFYCLLAAIEIRLLTQNAAALSFN